VNTPKSYKESFLVFIHNLQDLLCNELEEIDGAVRFREDLWQREGGGGGKTRIIENGAVIEKGGINTSAVHGKLSEPIQKYLQTESEDFFACGISLVIHPLNPKAPTAHANFRYFELYNTQGEIENLWFGGGMDMTPYYLYEEDAQHFHKTIKTVCDKSEKGIYEQYKKRCDEYFHNSHRGEARGIGGIFFDRLNDILSHDNDFWYQFTTQVGSQFEETYYPILRKRKSEAYTEDQKIWQEIRRGRYVEFNLLHDKGTLFGLKTNGRIESIFMSLPPTVRWNYDVQVTDSSEEAKLLQVLKNPKDWV